MKLIGSIATAVALLAGLAATPVAVAAKPMMSCSATPAGARGYSGTCHPSSSYNAFSMGVRCGFSNGRVHTYWSAPREQGVIVRVDCPAGSMRLSRTFSIFWYV